MRQRYPRHRCTFDQGLFDDPPLLLDWAVLPLGSGSALAFDCDEFCGLRGSVHLRSKWARSICVSTKNKDVLLSHLCPDGYQRTLTAPATSRPVAGNEPPCADLGRGGGNSLSRATLYPRLG